jgi:hypothetical protein
MHSIRGYLRLHKCRRTKRNLKSGSLLSRLQWLPALHNDFMDFSKIEAKKLDIEIVG